MRLIRFEGNGGEICYGIPQAENLARKVRGDVFSKFQVTDEQFDVKKLLAPLIPAQIICIGLNYRSHAKECGLKVPDYPVVFMKGVNTLQNPEDPIVLPPGT